MPRSTPPSYNLQEMTLLYDVQQAMHSCLLKACIPDFTVRLVTTERWSESKNLVHHTSAATAQRSSLR